MEGTKEERKEGRKEGRKERGRKRKKEEKEEGRKQAGKDGRNEEREKKKMEKRGVIVGRWGGKKEVYEEELGDKLTSSCKKHVKRRIKIMKAGLGIGRKTLNKNGRKSMHTTKKK